MRRRTGEENELIAGFERAVNWQGAVIMEDSVNWKGAAIWQVDVIQQGAGIWEMYR